MTRSSSDVLMVDAAPLMMMIDGELTIAQFKGGPGNDEHVSKT